MVNNYLQTIHEHYDSFYEIENFGSIHTLTVWADNCTEQFKSRFQMGWSVLYVNKSNLQTIQLFFFCPQHGKGPPDGLGGNVKTAIKNEEKFRRHLPAAVDIYLWLQQNFTAVKNPGTGMFSIRKRIFRFVPVGRIPRHHIVQSSEFRGISDFYGFGVNKGGIHGKVYHRFCPCSCEYCNTGDFELCENQRFLGPWLTTYLTVTEQILPSIKEQLEADIQDALESYKESQLCPFFVMYVNLDCPSPCFALINKDTVWNNRFLNYLLQHNATVSPGQSILIRYCTFLQHFVRQTSLCLPKHHLEKLDKNLIMYRLKRKYKERKRTYVQFFARMAKFLHNKATLFFISQRANIIG